MPAIDRLVTALAPFAAAQGISLHDMDPEALVASLPPDVIEDMLAPILRDEERARFNKFYDLFPDEGPFRRELYPKHIEFFAAGKNYRERMFLAANRIGKAQPVDEPVATPAGWKPIGDIRVGDMVLGSSGKPTRVTGVFPQGVRPILRLTGSDGSWTRCDANHLWRVRPTKKGKASDYVTMTAEELARRIADGERWMLPERAELQFEGARELPIDPYLVGLLIGDGGLTTDRVLLSTKDPEIVSYCREQAALWGCELRDLDGTTHHFATKRKIGGRHHNALRAALIGLGLVGCSSHRKRVPPEYMMADAADRLALLQGLMDTDGSVSPTSGARMFYSVNRSLCEDVAALVRSLGMNASVRHKKGKYAGSDHSSWLTGIAVSGHNIFRVPRKVRNQRYAAIKMRGIMVEAIEPDGEAQAVCIQVDAPDHLYVTRDCIVTHNTVAGAYEVSCHLTGLYPKWWIGRRFSRPVRVWAAGDTNETTRDIIQLELFGEVKSQSDGRKMVDGSGLVPRETLQFLPKWKMGVADMIDTIKVQHVSGGQSIIGLKSFDQGRRKFQGTAREVIWLDEECPIEIYGECMMRVATTRGILVNTFTPLMGLTDHVMQFLPQDMRPGE